MSGPQSMAELIPIASLSLERVARDSGIPRTDEEWEVHERRIAARRAAESRAEAEQCERSRRAKYADAGFPVRALAAAQRADETADAIVRVSRWRTEEQCILVLSGPKGIGKTVAATWWALRQPAVPVFIRASSFAASSRYDRDSRGDLLRAPAMVLDDLGTEYVDAKGSFLVDLDELIDTFYADARPLLITTNCDHNVFKSRYGERIADRMRECGEFFGLSGASRRGGSR